MVKKKEFSIFSANEFDELVNLYPDSYQENGYVYILDLGEKVKIGMSRSLPRRIPDLKRTLEKYGNNIIQHIAISPLHSNYSSNEKKLHEQFALSRKENTELFEQTFDYILDNLPLINFDPPIPEQAILSDIARNSQEYLLSWVKSRLSIITQAKKIITIKADQWKTASEVASLYGVQDDCLRKIVCLHREELSQDGLIIVSPSKNLDVYLMSNFAYKPTIETFRECIKIYSKDQTDPIIISNAGTNCFSGTAIRRLSLYLNNNIATEVANQLLNCAMRAINEDVTFDDYQDDVSACQQEPTKNTQQDEETSQNNAEKPYDVFDYMSWQQEMLGIIEKYLSKHNFETALRYIAKLYASTDLGVMLNAPDVREHC